MFSRIEDVRQSWQEESADTLKVMEAIPDQALNQSVGEGFRDLRRLAWHLAASIVELPAQCGLSVQGLPLDEKGHMAEPAPPRTWPRSAPPTAASPSRCWSSWSPGATRSSRRRT